MNASIGRGMTNPSSRRLSGARGRLALLCPGILALMVLRGLTWAATDGPAPDPTQEVRRLAELGERYRAAGDAAGLAAVEKDLAGMKAGRPAALTALGRLLHADEKDAEAAGVLEQVLALQPDDYEAEKELGEVYSELGQYEKAARFMEKALARKPQDYWLAMGLAKCYRLMGRLERSKEVFSQAKRIDSKDAEDYIRQGYVYLDAGADAQAKKEFEKAIALDTASPIGYIHMASYLARHRRYPEVEACLRPVAQQLETNPHADPSDMGHVFWGLGDALYAQGKVAEAEAVFRHAVEQSRIKAYQRALLLWYLGDAIAAQGKISEAERYYIQAAAACDPGFGCLRREWGDVVTRLGAFFIAHGRKPEAAALAERVGEAYKNLPSHEPAIDQMIRLAELYLRLGNRAKAKALLRRLLAPHGTLPAKTEADLAGVCLACGRLTDAEVLYLKAIDVFKIYGDRKSAAEALEGLAATYDKQGKGLEAAAARRQAEALRAQGGKS